MTWSKKPETLADRLRRLRARANLTQQKLAELSQLSIGIVTSIEAGRTTDPRISTILALARALRVGPGALIRGTELDVKQ
jgi:transcriptional regulator with XRE-family HTH domain